VCCSTCLRVKVLPSAAVVEAPAIRAAAIAPGMTTAALARPTEKAWPHMLARVGRTSLNKNTCAGVVPVTRVGEKPRVGIGPLKAERSFADKRNGRRNLVVSCFVFVGSLWAVSLYFV